jgi:hypothetical protein
MEADPDAGSFELIASPPAGLLMAIEVAREVDAHSAALWRGDEQPDDDFQVWLRSCWVASDQEEPSTLPDARSFLAAGGKGIHWYETPAGLAGFIPGRSGAHFKIDRNAFAASVASDPIGLRAD